MHTHMHNYCINIYVRNTLEHIQGCMHTRGMKQTHTYTDAYTQTYICMCIHECMQTHATYMHTFTYTYTNKCTHTSTHRHTLAHIHIHAHRCCRRIGRNPFKYFLNVWSILSILRTCNHSDGWLINITHTHTHTQMCQVTMQPLLCVKTIVIETEPWHSLFLYSVMMREKAFRLWCEGGEVMSSPCEPHRNCYRIRMEEKDLHAAMRLELLTVTTIQYIYF